jgi:hypothetical protein
LLGRVPVLQDHSIIQDTREHHEVKRPGYSFERPPSVFSGELFTDTLSWTRKATPHLLAEFAVGAPMHPPIAENQAEVILPVVVAPCESSPFFGVFVQTWTKYPYGL